ncbi:hypothetical protein H5410_003031, partial [Solanum commersonii]
MFVKLSNSNTGGSLLPKTSCIQFSQLNYNCSILVRTRLSGSSTRLFSSLSLLHGLLFEKTELKPRLIPTLGIVIFLSNVHSCCGELLG